MVVDEPTGLHRRVRRRGPYEHESAVLQPLGQGDRLGAGGAEVRGAPGRLVVLGGERPDVRIESAVLAQVQNRAGVGDRRVHLAHVPDDPRVGHQPGAVGVVEGGDLLGVEPGEGGTEGGSLAQDGDPREAGLEGLEGEPLEEGRLAVDRDAPLVVVVGEVLGGGTGPGAPWHTVGSDQQPSSGDVGHDDVARVAAASSMPSRASAKSRAVTRSAAGAASRPSVSGRGTISSRQTTSVPPASVAARRTSAQPRSTRPVFRAANRASPSSGGSHFTTSIESRKPTGPRPVKPPNAHPGRAGPGSVRIEVSGIQRPYAAKSVSVSHTASSGVGTVRRTSTGATQARSASVPPRSSRDSDDPGDVAVVASARPAGRARDSSSSRSPISRRSRSMTASTWLIR